MPIIGIALLELLERAGRVERLERVADLAVDFIAGFADFAAVRRAGFAADVVRRLDAEVERVDLAAVERVDEAAVRRAAGFAAVRVVAFVRDETVRFALAAVAVRLLPAARLVVVLEPAAFARTVVERLAVVDFALVFDAVVRVLTGLRAFAVTREAVARFAFATLAFAGVALRGLTETLARFVAAFFERGFEADAGRADFTLRFEAGDRTAIEWPPFT